MQQEVHHKLCYILSQQSVMNVNIVSVWELVFDINKPTQKHNRYSTYIYLAITMLNHGYYKSC